MLRHSANAAFGSQHPTQLLFSTAVPDLPSRPLKQTTDVAGSLSKGLDMAKTAQDRAFILEARHRQCVERHLKSPCKVLKV